MEKALAIICGFVTIIIIVLVCYFSFTPGGLAACNRYEHTLQEVDNATNYETKKQVEDTCRSMISSYNADKLTYEQYKDSESELERSWAASAKTRANQTASNYNNYILKNNYVWENNIPSDIDSQLPYLK